MAIEFYAPLDLNSNQINELGDGTLNTDGINLGQLRQAIRDLDWKQSVRVATSADLNLAAPGASVDGVALSVGDRILVKAQTTGSENGIYEWQGAAVPAIRAVDYDAATEVTSGSVVVVSEGSNADQLWVLKTNDPITIGVTALTYILVGGAPYVTLVGDGVSQTIVVTHNLGTENTQVTVFHDALPRVEVYPEVRHTDANSITLRFTPAPAVNEFRVVIS